jgi:hypothetical protein
LYLINEKIPLIKEYFNRGLGLAATPISKKVHKNTVAGDFKNIISDPLSAFVG